MDVFLGSYKDRTNHTKDFRYFAGIFFLFRAAIITLSAITHATAGIVLTGLILALFSASVAFFQSHISSIHNTLDTFFLLYLSVALIAVVKCLIVNSEHIFSLFNVVVLFVHLIYVTSLLLYWVVLKKRMPQALFKMLYLHCRDKRPKLSALIEQRPLLLTS